MKRRTIALNRCGLCHRTDMSDGREKLADGRHGFPATDLERAEVAFDICWWCFDRAWRWGNRRARQRSGIEYVRWELSGYRQWPGLTSAEMVEFVAHVLSQKRRPDWVGNPDAFHTRADRKPKRSMAVGVGRAELHERGVWLFKNDCGVSMFRATIADSQRKEFSLNVYPSRTGPGFIWLVWDCREPKTAAELNSIFGGDDSESTDLTEAIKEGVRELLKIAIV